jgi:hypothetical protein
MKRTAPDLSARQILFVAFFVVKIIYNYKNLHIEFGFGYHLLPV